MKARLTFAAGGRAGESVLLTKPYISIGRHPHSDVRFGPDADLEVSSRHAAILARDGLWTLRDLGSTNGTFVNGRRLIGDHVLTERDVVQLGKNGPVLAFALVRDPSDAPEPAAPPPTVAEPRRTFSYRSPRPTPAVETTTGRIRVEVARQTTWLRRVVLLLALLLAGLAAAYGWSAVHGSRAAARERAALMSRLDSLVSALRGVAAREAGVRAALTAAEAEATMLQGEVAAAKAGSERWRRLTAAIDTAATRQQHLADVAALPADSISRANRDAIALLLVEFPDGRRFSGTAFAVRSDGGSVILATNRHLIQDSSGARPSRLGVVFHGSSQNFRAEVIAADPSRDLALVRSAVRGGAPVVRGIESDPAAIDAGQPVAVLGFPLGLELPLGGDWSKVGATATTTLGTATRSVGELLQLDSYGAPGASGSPVFDRQGNVVGVVYGGEPESHGRIVYAVPARYVNALLDAVTADRGAARGN